jgi:ribosomal-protein-alanine N-acetyltransferase
MSITKALQTFPQLETKNLLLRRIRPADASALFKVLSDDEVTEFYDDDTFVDVSQARDQIDTWWLAIQEDRHSNRLSKIAT